MARDESGSISRIVKLVRGRKLSPRLVLKMLFCEITRRSVKTRIGCKKITSNNDLLELITNYSPCKVILFRAGLIINKTVLAAGVLFYNIHCAKIPEYGGIGSIHRAIRDKSFKQTATLHQVTESIDSGVVYDTEPYELNPELGYCANEDKAYDAGIRLLVRVIRQQQEILEKKK